MAIENIHLRKLLKIMFLEASPRRGELKKDIREDRAREMGSAGNGGDFYGPFWFDAKAHALGGRDLFEAVSARIAANWRCGNLYPQLRDGFLLWWNERRRWINEPFQQGQSLNAIFAFPGVNATVKLDNILSVRDGQGVEHYVYPYFAPEPILGEEAARWGLWLLGNAFNMVPHQELRILDVIRGRTFSVDRNPLQGNEEEAFRQCFRSLLIERDTLRDE